MNPALRVAATGMAAQQAKVDALAHNIANTNTTAFKRSEMAFETLFYQNIEGPKITNRPGEEFVAPIQIGRGVHIAGNLKVHTQGTIETTGRSLDLAIDGDGFFQVTKPDGTTAYTRDGNLTISDKGLLTTHSGYALVPEITIPQDAQEVQISANGVVSATVAGNTEPVELGKIEIARFINNSGLLASGENLYYATPASGEAMVGTASEEGFGRIVQGGLESSNVEIVQEMVEMIAAQRAYDINSKVIVAANEMGEKASALVR